MRFFNARLLVAILALMLTNCAAPMPMAMCVAGETRACACAGGVMGSQACNATGSGFGACGMCAAVAMCGDGTCNGTETCSSCPADCRPCMAMCGDRVCNGTETCMSCPGDCGMCMMTPRCGDGTCNGMETCSNCADDCGSCPPRCGDGTCNGTETCMACAADCSEMCPSMCMACAQDVDCPAGSTCGNRRCDGARGCYPRNDPNAACGIIGGVQCPATSAYNLCTADAECGAFAACQRFGDGRNFCARRCAVTTDCPAPPADSTTTRFCDPPSMRCYLRCTAPGTCPFGLSCFRFGDGTYGYCS